MNKTPIKNRFSIICLNELLTYAANQISVNIRRSKTELILLKIKVNYDSAIGNSHSAPIDGEMNWGNTYKGRVTSYSGWYGRVWVFFSKDPNTHFSSEFKNSLIHPGTGGYGLYNIGAAVENHIGHPKELPNNRYDVYAFKEQTIYPLSFACKIFLDDLPAIRGHALITEEEITQHYEGVYENDNSRRIYSRGN